MHEKELQVQVAMTYFVFCRHGASEASFFASVVLLRAFQREGNNLDSFDAKMMCVLLL
jgi:hypothetical protein